MRSKNLRTASQVQRAYDQNIGNYDRIRYGTLGGQYVDKKEKDFVDGVIQGLSVLEVGTATGRFAVSLARRKTEYVGVDLSEKMLRATSERTSHSAILIQMDGSHLGFRSYFDFILCFRTFHFLQKPHMALQEMFSALKPGGEALVTFEIDNLLRRLALSLRIGTSEQCYYKISEVKKMFLNAGFEVEESGSVMRIPVTLYRRCPRSFLWMLNRLERIWPWPMHGFAMGRK